MTERTDFHQGQVTLYAGDCLDVLKTLPAASIESCVTDPPYHLTSIVRRFGADGAAPAKRGNKPNLTGVYERASTGFMGQRWDGGDIAFRPELWVEVFRVLKPGAHVLAFSAPRTYHRMACAVEDAGFDIRDMTAWLYGLGFPKSHDVSKAIDKAAGAMRTGTGEFARVGCRAARAGEELVGAASIEEAKWKEIARPATDLAKQWDGWGTALKPALEPICLARKPLIGTVAENVIAHGTGALNIDGCRVERLDGKPGATLNETGGNWRPEAKDAVLFHGRTKDGRWPANVIHDGSDEVVAAFPERVVNAPSGRAATSESHIYGDGWTPKPAYMVDDGKGSAARFFYSAKADADDRLGSNHPTVKPVDLMAWLVRLVTPKGGTVLDPFAGTGTTGEAAVREGVRAVLIEREAPYRADIARRMDLCRAGRFERACRSAKARGKSVGPGPLFGDAS